LHWHLPNLAINLAEAEFDQIWEKWPNFGFAEAEIWCNPTPDIVNSKLSDKRWTFY